MKKMILLGILAVAAGIPSAISAQSAKWVIQPNYHSVTKFADDMYKVKYNKYCGIINNEGNEIVGMATDSITDMTEGCALLLLFEKEKLRLTGILHKDQKVVNITEEWYVGDYPFFSEGKLPVYNKSGKYGYIGTNGSVLIDFDYGNVHPFSEGWAAVSKGKNILGKGLSYIKKKKEKMFYINEKGNMMNMPQNIGNIYTASTFKNGEALLVTDENVYCFINTEGMVKRMDNNVMMTFDHKYALADDENAGGDMAKANVAYDGPNTFSENNLYGYVDKSNIILPAQFTYAQQFNNGYAIASVDNMYGVLKLVNGNFGCRVQKGKLNVNDKGEESVDFVITVPDEWKNEKLELACRTDDKVSNSTSMNGNNSTSRIFSFILPKGKHDVTVIGKNIVLWNSSMGNKGNGSMNGGNVSAEEISYNLSSGKIKASDDDNAYFYITVKNNTDYNKNFTVKMVGKNMRTVNRNISLAGGQSQKISMVFTKVYEDEVRYITITSSDSDNKITKKVSLTTNFVNF